MSELLESSPTAVLSASATHNTHKTLFYFSTRYLYHYLLNAYSLLRCSSLHIASFFCLSADADVLVLTEGALRKSQEVIMR